MRLQRDQTSGNDARIHAGLRHGFFEYAVRCEIVHHERRRLTIQVGKTYQFTIPKRDSNPCFSLDTARTRAEKQLWRPLRFCDH